MSRQVCLAVDLGAGSGRVVAGLYDGSILCLHEVHRFANDPIRHDCGWHWQLDRLFAEIKVGLAKAVKEYGEDIVSVGVDSWGVDYGLLDERGELLGAPFQYRDARTEGMAEQAARTMPIAEIYRRTGIQPMFFNTLFQLLAERDASQALLGRARRLLFIPDLIHYFLSDRMAVERSIASTSQLLSAASGQWDQELIEAFDFPPTIFGEIVEAGTDLGALRPELAAEVGLRTLRVITPGGHDTASAVAGVPADGPRPVFVSSGTWSLFGREIPAPILTEVACAAGFSNEAGVGGTTRFLKNIAGMWLLQECRRAWSAEHGEVSYDILIAAAAQAEPFVAMLDPDAADFQAPENMHDAIVGYFARTGQCVIRDPAQITRVVLEGIAMRYRHTAEQLAELTGEPITQVHIVGGGSQNRLLNQFAADALACPVVAGPVEATSVGNLLLQLIALGKISSIAEGRDLVRRSFQTETFTPENPQRWCAAYERFLGIAY